MLYILISVLDGLDFCSSHSCMKNKKNFCVPFLANQILYIDLDEIQDVVTTCWIFEDQAGLFCTSNIQGRELC